MEQKSLESLLQQVKQLQSCSKAKTTGWTEPEIEFFNERAAIREHDGGMSKEDAERMAREDVEAYRHRCECLSVVRMYREKGSEAVKSYLLQVEKHRGSDSAQRLRNDALEMLKTGDKK